MDKERRWILIVKLIENITFPCLKLHLVPYFASHLGFAQICEFMSWKNPSGQAYWSVWTRRWQLRMCFSVTVNRYHHLQGKKDSTTDLFVVFQMFLCNKPSPALGFLASAKQLKVVVVVGVVNECFIQGLLNWSSLNTDCYLHSKMSNGTTKRPEVNEVFDPISV